VKLTSNSFDLGSINRLLQFLVYITKYRNFNIIIGF